LTFEIQAAQPSFGGGERDVAQGEASSVNQVVECMKSKMMAGPARSCAPIGADHIIRHWSLVIRHYQWRMSWSENYLQRFGGIARLYGRAAWNDCMTRMSASSASAASARGW